MSENVDHGLYPSPNNFEPYTEEDLQLARAFNPAAPLPPLKPHPRTNSWEPAARRYRDLEPEEREQ